MENSDERLIRELLEALLLAEGVAQRVIAATSFDEIQVSDWRPRVGSAIDAARERLREQQYAFTPESLADEPYPEDVDARARLLRACAAGMREVMAEIERLRAVAPAVEFTLVIPGTLNATTLAFAAFGSSFDEPLDHYHATHA